MIDIDVLLVGHVAEVVAAIQQGEEVKTEDIENLQTILTLISELDTLGIGGNVVQGIAQGMTEGGWDSDAETVVGNLEAALNSALDAHSPAQRMVPMGENVSAGIGKGASEYDFSGDAETIASALEGALNTALQTALSESAVSEDGGAGKAIGSGIAESIGSGRICGKAGVRTRAHPDGPLEMWPSDHGEDAGDLRYQRPR